LEDSLWSRGNWLDDALHSRKDICGRSLELENRNKRVISRILVVERKGKERVNSKKNVSGEVIFGKTKTTRQGRYGIRSEVGMPLSEEVSAGGYWIEVRIRE